jgi:hypothetical protein
MHQKNFFKSEVFSHCALSIRTICSQTQTGAIVSLGLYKSFMHRTVQQQKD